MEMFGTRYHRFRLIECPPGYTISRDDSFPDQDRCLICPSGMYSIIVANSTLISCLQCPVGARCTGGGFVEAIDGFWRRDGAQAVEVFRCDPGKNLLLKIELIHCIYFVLTSVLF